MVTQNRISHDHVLLLKSMMMWKIDPHEWRVSDLLLILKTVSCPEKCSTLSELANVYAPYFDHIHSDGLSGATAYRHPTNLRRPQLLLVRAHMPSYIPQVTRASASHHAPRGVGVRE